MFKGILAGLLFLTAISFAQNSPHGKQLRFDCSECHVSSSWKISFSQMSFNHSLTGFELQGKHKIADCRTCHTSLVFNNASTECRDCHSEPHQNTLGKECSRCHTASSWTPVNMMQIHNQFRFSLAGVHNIPDCQSCHCDAKNFIFSGTSIECYFCHQKDYQNSDNPQHALLSLSINCDQCHTLKSTGWTAEKFVHVSISLSGAHKELDCNQCHTVSNVTQQCFDCHQKDFNQAVNPNHISGKFPHDCLVCHNSDTWIGARFDHTATKFPLTGTHTIAACSQCHINEYKGTPTDCAACHKYDFDKTTNPNHFAIGISTACAACHNSSGWIPSSFVHASTGFELLGAHNKLQCSQCHTGSTAVMKTDCFSCHQNDYNNAEGHLAQSFPHDCLQCHNSNNWDGAQFDHAKSNFPLTGAHINTTCNQCHSGGYKGTSAVCFSCHQNNFDNTSNPRHAVLSIPNTCETCHTANSGWKPAQFPNHNNYFVIDGAHTAKAGDCYSCHKGNYNSTPNTCFGCHQSDFDNAVNPSHNALGFPQDCLICHTSSAWQPASYKNHDAQFFPIYSGNHRGKWNTCADCHTVAANFKMFECVNCHEHARSETDSKHRNIKDYVYLSTECYRCHPSGKSDLPQSTIYY